MALGDMASMTREERISFYVHAKAEACSNETSGRMDRTFWLHQEHDKKPFRNFLDLACNEGFCSRWMVDTYGFGSLLGIDPCVEGIVRAQKAIKDQNNPDKAIYICAPYEIIITPTLFDGISAFEFIEHVTQEEGEHLIRYVWEHLDVEGRAFICTPNIDGKWGETNPDPCHINLFSKAKLAGTIDKVIGKPPTIVAYSDKCDYLLAKFVKD